jgi:hypothetical protein
MLQAGLFTLALVVSGYSYADFGDKSKWTPAAACLGFVLCGLMVSAGWWLGAGAVTGMLVFSFLTIGLGFWRWRARRAVAGGEALGLGEVFLCLAVTGLVAAEFFPLWRDGGTVHQLPEIFDLPKHISVLGACVRATRLPVENPWVPQADLAYATAFYGPFAGIAAALGSAGAILKVAATMPVVTTFLLLATVAAAGRRLGLSRLAILTSLLLASVIGGYIPVLAFPGRALGVTLATTARLGGLPWFEDPFTYFVYVPNHVFAATCILAAWIEATRSDLRMSGMLRSGLLLAGALQASAALVPHAVFAAVLLASLYWWGRQGRRSLAGSTALLGVFSLASAPFALAALGWAQGAESVQLGFRFSLEGWMTQLLAIGPFAGLLIMGIGIGALWGGHWKSYLGLLAPSLLFLWAVPHMEISIKSAMVVRLLGVLAAALPIEWLLSQPASKTRRVLVVGVILIFCHAAYFTSRAMIPLIQSAYEPWDAATASLVKTLQDLPWMSRVSIAPPNQELAALSGHNTWMDFSPLRRGAYLPAKQAEAVRGSLEDLNRLGLGSCPDSIAEMRAARTPVLVAASAKRFLRSQAANPETKGYIFVPDSWEIECQGFQPVAPRLVPLGAEPWSIWPGALPGVTLDSSALSVSAATPVDAGLTKPMQLPAGRYRVRVQVSGTVTGPSTGAAHLSLLGKRKLIAIPPGEHSHRVFEAALEQATPIAETLAFGLGGWTTGAGTLRLEELSLTLLATPR